MFFSVTAEHYKLHSDAHTLKSVLNTDWNVEFELGLSGLVDTGANGES